MGMGKIQEFTLGLALVLSDISWIYESRAQGTKNWAGYVNLEAISI